MGSNAPSNLPSSSSSNIIITPATIAERNKCWQINVAEWGGTFTPAQYNAREEYLLNQSLTKDGQITYWILTTADGKPDDRPILSSCETFKKVGLVAKPGSGRVEEVVCHGIGSVFCAPENRGRGYAGRMMKELGRKFDEGWQQPEGKKGVFSTLYSDIGLKFYTKFGWKPYPSTHISLEPITEDIYRSTLERLKLAEPHDLTAKDLETKICPQDVEQTKTRLSQSDSKTTIMAIRPDYEHMSWHHAREEFKAETLGVSPPTIKGATVPLLSKDTAVSMIWTRMYGRPSSPDTLYALRLILPPSSAGVDKPTLVNAIASLLLRAQLEAKKWNMEVLELWSPDDLTVEAARRLDEVESEKEIVVVRDEESICSLRWTSEGEGDAKWVENEKFAWC